MRILIVAATDAEMDGIVARLGARRRHGDRVSEYSAAGRAVHLLVTGVGMVATAAWCSRALAERSYDLALNAGLCGSFDESLVPGTVVHVVSDCLAELGAEDGDRFLTLQELGLEDSVDRADARPGSCAELRNAAPPAISALDDLRKARGITVNTAHGHERSIAAVVERLHPQVESMEGAAFMYACLMHGIPFAQIRAVSNVVERRNRSSWKVEEAIGALAGAVAEIVTGS
jgi:futalosine hydrolase